MCLFLHLSSNRRASFCILPQGPWLHPARRTLREAPLAGHSAVARDGGPLIHLFYKFVRAHLSEAFTRSSEVDVRESPMLSVALGSAAARRGTAFTETRFLGEDCA